MFRAICGLLALPIGFALLQKGQDSFLGIFGIEYPHEALLKHTQGGLKLEGLLVLVGFESHLYGRGWLAGEGRGQGGDGLIQGICRYGLVDKPHADSFIRIDLPSGEDQVQTIALGDGAEQRGPPDPKPRPLFSPLPPLPDISSPHRRYDLQAGVISMPCSPRKIQTHGDKDR